MCPRECILQLTALTNLQILMAFVTTYTALPLRMLIRNEYLVDWYSHKFMTADWPSYKSDYKKMKDAV